MIPIILIVLSLAASVEAAELSPGESPRIEELEERLNKLEAERSDEKAAPPAGKPGPSRRFNPAISINGLFLGAYSSEGNSGTNAVETGMEIQEVELDFSANVDHWLFARLSLAMEETDEIEVEEFVAEGLLGQGLSLRAGKYFASFGKHNLLHTHNFPFIDAPLSHVEILGDEGLNEIGLSLDYLVPLPFYSSLTVQFLEGDNALFDGPRNDDFLYLAHSKNLFDLTEDLTMELGGSYATGRSDNPVEPGGRNHLAGADLTFKWKPAGRERYRTFVWQSEFLNVSGVREAWGVYSLAQHQFARRWWLQGRYDFFTRDDVLDRGDQRRASALLAFVPSEFMTLRLQYNHFDPDGGPTDHQLLLQLNFTMGSHPAHAY